MTAPIHTYGAKCLLADDDPDLSAWHSSPSPPKVRTQFFYTSSLPIDDPLSPLPPPSGGQSAGNERAPPQPFSARDNMALENAWKQLQITWENSTGQQKPQEGTSIPARNTQISVSKRIPNLERKRQTGSRENISSVDSHESSPHVSTPILDDQLSNVSKTRPNREVGSVDVRSKGSWEGMRVRSMQENDARDINQKYTSSYRKRAGSSIGFDPKTVGRKTSSSSPYDDTASLEEMESGSLHGNPSRDVSISGSPFIRAPLSQPQTPLGRSVETSSLRDVDEEPHAEPQSRGSAHIVPKPSGLRTSVRWEGSPEEPSLDTDGESEEQRSQLLVPVGVSRLHLVELPNLKMKPIYWSPLHDVSNILRSTWFYRNTMLPVETELANRLESGYLYFKPWTETWQDELNSCVENGAEAESKIVYKLWSKEEPIPTSRPPTQDRKSTSSGSGAPQETPDTTVDDMTFDENVAAGETVVHSETIKNYKNSSAIYVDAKNAQILRPSLLPSASRGRKPLSAIRKGRQIGIPVVRGFSRRLWDQLHPSKPSPVDVRRYVRHTQTRNMAASSGQVCYGCAIEESRPTPTDLILVIHGIGQKLSERMESWHFTHAINSFRSNVNLELNSDPVWPHVRPDHGGIMVLPVNWRSTLSLEDSSFGSPVGEEDSATNRFSLNDITPETIPAVRSLISDVMLDIPYYLSHHKPKILEAVAKEANRVYRLWCKNNPGFQQHGRVHLIAHSLGSAMALDILSHQPTKIPDFDFSKISLHRDIFEFDTKNLFVCGSPIGFFLLLNKANLLPRRSRNKPGSDGDDMHRGVAGEADTYGCLAIDNLYNIMHTTDPITYRVNAAVDTQLASTLRPASIPSTSSTFWQSLGSVFRWNSSSIPSISPSHPTRPPAVSKLPSNVELETHNFTREEIAEKRMFLLNDNGQIDYFLSGGGGPLNIQYLNMLSAHSSYWTLTDFVRFVVIEVARRQGRDGTLLAFRAEKKKGYRT